MMKYIMILLMSLSATACGTLGGAMQGAGEDLNKAGEYIRTVGK
jgi:predicted small secreted protein